MLTVCGWGRRLASARRRRSGRSQPRRSTPGQFSSTAQDLDRGKRSEVDYLNGLIVQRGGALGLRRLESAGVSVREVGVGGSWRRWRAERYADFPSAITQKLLYIYTVSMGKEKS
jgi:Ketopantoate reductase PanE/ApbA C terminal